MTQSCVSIACHLGQHVSVLQESSYHVAEQIGSAVDEQKVPTDTC